MNLAAGLVAPGLKKKSDGRPERPSEYFQTRKLEPAARVNLDLGEEVPTLEI